MDKGHDVVCGAVPIGSVLLGLEQRYGSPQMKLAVPVVEVGATDYSGEIRLALVGPGGRIPDGVDPSDHIGSFALGPDETTYDVFTVGL